MHLFSASPFQTPVHNPPAGFCGISKLTYVSFIIVLTFIVCISQEFTFILNYNAYVTPSNILQDSILLRSLNSSKLKISVDDEFPPTDDWRKVTDDVSVYSAFWDNRFRGETLVRIVGGAKIGNGTLTTMKCLLKYNYSAVILNVSTDSEILIEHHDEPCKAVYIKCLVKSNNSPQYVAVVPTDWNETWTIEPLWMKVHILQNYSRSTIGVCVRPMFNFSDVFKISEFIAYYEVLGVTHFTFYNYDVSERVISYLRTLKSVNYSLDILPWSLPTDFGSMWSIGQLASVNDCMHRNLGKNTYIVVVDLDEFVTPTHAMTLQDILTIQDVPQKFAASFVIRSTVFCAEYKQDNLPTVIPPFKTQSNIYRENYFYPFLIRSKYIAKPFMVHMAGVHNVWRFIHGWEERFVPISQAVLHHYRDELCVDRNTNLEKGIIDVKSRKYLSYLMRSKAVEVWKNLFVMET